MLTFVVTTLIFTIGSNVGYDAYNAKQVVTTLYFAIGNNDIQVFLQLVEL